MTVKRGLEENRWIRYCGFVGKNKACKTMHNWFVKIGWIIAAITIFAGCFVSVWPDWFKNNRIISIIIFALLGICPPSLRWLEDRNKFRKGWKILSAYSSQITSKACREITGIANSIKLPEVGEVINCLRQKRRVVVTGDAGVGKTGIVVEISKIFKLAYFIFIDARYICNCKSLQDVSEMIGLTEYSLFDTIRAKARTPKKPVVVVIDQCDSIRRIHGQYDIIMKLLKRFADIDNIGIIVICRTEESKGLKEHIKGKSEIDVGEVHVKQLDKELAQEQLRQLGFVDAIDELIEMSRNLFMLSLIADLVGKPGDADLRNVTNILDFWEKYRGSLEAEILNNNDNKYRVTACAAKYAKQCLIDDRGTCELPPIRGEEENVLTSRKVLIQDPIFTQRYRFRHEKMRDYMYSHEAVYGRRMGLEAIEEELDEQAGLVAPVMAELYLKADDKKAAELILKAISNE